MENKLFSRATDEPVLPGAGADEEQNRAGDGDKERAAGPDQKKKEKKKEMHAHVTPQVCEMSWKHPFGQAGRNLISCLIWTLTTAVSDENYQWREEGETGLILCR